jgi:type IV secretion system protein TrbC
MKTFTRHVCPTRGTCLSLLLLFGLAVPLLAQQSPWEHTAQVFERAFSGIIARAFSIVAIVIGGLQLAMSDGGGKRTVAQIIFGVGMALGAAQFVVWAF